VIGPAAVLIVWRSYLKGGSDVPAVPAPGGAGFEPATRCLEAIQPYAVWHRSSEAERNASSYRLLVSAALLPCRRKPSTILLSGPGYALAYAWARLAG